MGANWGIGAGGSALGICLAWSVVTPLPAVGADKAASSPTPPTIEFAAGAEATFSAWAAYTTSTVVLAWPSEDRAPDVRVDGWRLRGGGGYWGYRDHLTRKSGTGHFTVPMRGNGSFADALLGYQSTTGPLTLKLFAGVAYRHEKWRPDDAHADRNGGAVGARAVLESWLVLAPAAFAQLDLSWNEIRDEVTARGRLGWRPLPWLAVGPEAAWWTSAGDEAGRVAGFARVEWSGGEASLAAGLIIAGDKAPQPYAALGVLFRY